MSAHGHSDLKILREFIDRRMVNELPKQTIFDFTSLEEVGQKHDEFNKVCDDVEWLGIEVLSDIRQAASLYAWIFKRKRSVIFRDDKDFEKFLDLLSRGNHRLNVEYPSEDKPEVWCYFESGYREKVGFY